MELTNALRKIVRSLSETKHRRAEGLFVVEGSKCISDTAGAFVCRYLFARPSWLNDNAAITHRLSPDETFETTASDMERMSHLSNPADAIAVYEIPASQFDKSVLANELSSQLVVALDRIQDPGNLGTIIRLCDWMGVTTILASTDTTDVWSPKVVQSTMGAIARVRVIYCDLPIVLSSWPAPVFGTFLSAPSIYTADLGSAGIVVFGNEGQGISGEVAACVTRRLFIPSFPPERPTSESLNVATAAAITLSQFRSRQLHSRN